MNTINGMVEVGDYVAGPTKRPGQGLAMFVGYVEEVRDNGKLKVKPVYVTTRAHVNRDGTYQSKVIEAGLCVRVADWMGNTHANSEGQGWRISSLDIESRHHV